MKRLATTLVAAVTLSVASRGDAQTLGVRAGVSGNPDQFYAGVHYESDPLVDRLRFRPNLEIGVGDGQTLVALNLELAYRTLLPRTLWNVYFGAGPALNIYRFAGTSNAEGGFNILLGLEHQRGLFAELKAGLGDSPGAKFGIGYTFRQRAP